MDYLAEKLTAYVLAKNVIKEEDFEIYRYGFQTGLEILVFACVCLIAAIRMQMVGAYLLFFLVLFSLRSFVGGIHMTSYKGCFFVSCTVTIVALWVLKNYNLRLEISFLITSSELVMIKVLKPVEHINRSVSKEENRTFIERRNKVLLVNFLLICILVIFKLNLYLNVVTITLGIIIGSMMLGSILNLK